MSAREQILGRLRPIQGIAPARHPSPQPTSLAGSDLVTRFIDCAVALQSTAERLPDLAAVPAAVARYLAAKQLPQDIVIWPGLNTLDWATPQLKASARNSCGDDLVGVTGCFAAIAETGTLMMCSSAATPAATSLLPETHFAIVPVARIVPTMEAGFALLRQELGQPPRAVNFVSGPSRTGDIEQTMTLGAHGPYRVHLLVVG